MCLPKLVEVNGIAADASKLDWRGFRYCKPSGFTGNFDDVDGSESHYLMLEIPQQWQVHSPGDNGVTHVHNGVSYYRVQVDDNTDPESLRGHYSDHS